MFTFLISQEKKRLQLVCVFISVEENNIDTIIVFTYFFMMFKKQQITLYTKPIKSADTSTTSRFCYYASDLVTGL